MANPRALAALDRIERALARIEAAAAAPPPAGADGEDVSRLLEAHDRLRRQVIGAIGEIDDLIAAAERG